MSLETDELIGEIPLELGADLDADMLTTFVADGREQLENIEQAALSLERDAHDAEVIHTLFRAFHTFKGNAGFLELTAVSQLAHRLESLLDAVREGRLEINSDITEIILKGRDTLHQFVNEIDAQITGRHPRQPVVILTSALKAVIGLILDGEVEAQPSTLEKTENLPSQSTGTDSHASANQAIKVAVSKLDGLVDLAGELLIAQSLIAQNI